MAPWAYIPSQEVLRGASSGGGAAQGIVPGMAFWRTSSHPPLSWRTQIFVGLGMPPWDSESQGHWTCLGGVGEQ